MTPSPLATLDIAIAAAAGEVEYAVGRKLVAADMALLDSARGTTAPPLKALRESHHQLARLLAQGLKQVEVAAITGFSQSRISILKADPAFKELLAHYSAERDSAFADIHGQLAALSVDVLGELRDRLLDEPESFKNTELLAFMTTTLDRVGFGAKTKVEHTNIHLSASDLAEMKRMVSEAQNGSITRGNGVPAAAGLSESGEAGNGVLNFQRAEYCEGEADEGLASEGQDIRAESGADAAVVLQFAGGARAVDSVL